MVIHVDEYEILVKFVKEIYNLSDDEIDEYVTKFPNRVVFEYPVDEYTDIIEVIRNDSEFFVSITYNTESGSDVVKHEAEDDFEFNLISCVRNIYTFDLVIRSEKDLERALNFFRRFF